MHLPPTKDKDPSVLLSEPESNLYNLPLLHIEEPEVVLVFTLLLDDDDR